MNEHAARLLGYAAKVMWFSFSKEKALCLRMTIEHCDALRALERFERLSEVEDTLVTGCQAKLGPNHVTTTTAIEKAIQTKLLLENYSGACDLYSALLETWTKMLGSESQTSVDSGVPTVQFLPPGRTR